MSATTVPTIPVDPAAPPGSGVKPLPAFRLNLMRVGYLVLGVGLVFLKWPIFLSGSAAALPTFEGVEAALLTGMSLLALLGLRYPVAMLPVLLLEVTWKMIWLAAVALPHVLAGDLNPATTSVLTSFPLIVVIIAVIPWDYAWKRFVLARGDRWR